MNPTKQQVQSVIDTFEKAKEMTINAGSKDLPVSMFTGGTVEVGAPMCHAAYYGLGLGMIRGTMFNRAADKMAENLGFDNADDLREWGHENPNLWGNVSGGKMFISRTAFTEEHLNLDTIIEHWKGVQSRLPE